MARTKTPPAPKPEPAAEVNPRTACSKERLAEATELLSKELASGEWVSSNEIHRRLGKQVSEGMFGRAKQALGIEHRRVKPEDGGQAEYQWRLPAKKK